ncbi:UPF0545 protein C22orf39 homolog [Topomyia yanbarensis]|uniref:UPF0545 protein C22orf39 homolog n=1 Tax=Topomyia yanbarensis TaxID=2498891 RepID=UPI00273C0799|nr:UPF0545 protein C22orf39 homolog [Topomyia yanbarensis]
MTLHAHNLPSQPKTPEQEEVFRNLWSIRPCFFYSEEYDDCTSIKARFNQYFIHGESIDCTQWKRDFDNCVRFERNQQDTKSALQLIESERERRMNRLGAHYRNDVWKKREQAPKDWSKPLPEKMQKEYEQSYLALKAQEIQGGKHTSTSDQRTMCVVM